MPRQPGFWSVEDRLRALSAQGDPLEQLLEIVDFALFRPVLDEALGGTDRAKGVRPPFDAVLKLKMLYLQARHGLSFEATGHLVRDRLSRMRFCGLSLADPVPDANTLWDVREALIRSGALDRLFARLDRAIRDAGYLPMSGQIIDASLVAAPIGLGPIPRRGCRHSRQATQHRGGEGGHQGRQQGGRDLARQARQGGAEGHRRALDRQDPQGQGRARRQREAGTSRSRPSATSRTSASTAGMASSVGRRSPTPPRRTGPGCARA